MALPSSISMPCNSAFLAFCLIVGCSDKYTGISEYDCRTNEGVCPTGYTCEDIGDGRHVCIEDGPPTPTGMPSTLPTDDTATMHTEPIGGQAAPIAGAPFAHEAPPLGGTSPADEDPPSNVDDVDDTIGALCGNGIVEVDEACDDPTAGEACPYGEGQCQVCNEQCQWVDGRETHCGDHEINGPESCDGETWCNRRCDRIRPPCADAVDGCPEIEYVPVEGGEFSVYPNRFARTEGVPVTIAPFEIAKTEVTVAMLRACVDAGACSVRGSNGNGRPGRYTADIRGWEDHAVWNVDFSTAAEFAIWMGADLPTMSQWQFAATNGGRTPCPWGDCPDWLNRFDVCNYAHVSQQTPIDDRLFCEPSGGGSLPPCRFPEGHSQRGVCDLVGNVAEWVVDENPRQVALNPGDGRRTFPVPADGSALCINPGCDNLAELVANDGPYTHRLSQSSSFMSVLGATDQPGRSAVNGIRLVRPISVP